MPVHVVWMRNDLRLTDNFALSAACSEPDAEVIVVYIATPEQWRWHNVSPRQAGLIQQGLALIQDALSERDIPFVYQQCGDFNACVDWLADWCKAVKADVLFYNRQYELNESRRDQKLVSALKDSVQCRAFDDALLFSPGQLTTAAGEMFKVFTPFRKALIAKLSTTELRSLPAPGARKKNSSQTGTALSPFDYPILPQTVFPAGEENAIRRLRHFCQQVVQDYLTYRDFPAYENTSILSAYLSVGMLSPRQCFNRLFLENPDFLNHPESGAFCWFNELVWREFYHHLLAAHPRLSMHQPFIEWSKAIGWETSDPLLEAWKRGNTGFPIVDAAMRQLNEIGWMHNRLRMIAASFLVKDLLIDWREGEKYFMSQLTDGNLAANNGGWQWAASTGNDPVPYFRIFNPQTQGERFDPDGAFIRQWIPELNQVPDKYIHIPHKWAENEGIVLSYPTPVVDHSVARKKAISAYEGAKKEFLRF